MKIKKNEILSLDVKIVQLNKINIYKNKMNVSMESFECPICMDTIENVNNRVTTECGHCFHTNCLMKSIAHNGFGCPYCRTAMAEQVHQEGSEWDDDDDDDDDDDEEEELYNDHSLRGMRWLFQREAGEELDHHEDELEDEQEEDEMIEDPLYDVTLLPSPAFIVEKLTSQGFTMEDLVKSMLLHGHEEYDANAVEYNKIDDELFGKFRIIISNFRPAPAPAPEPAPEPIQESLINDFEAEAEAESKFIEYLDSNREQQTELHWA